MKVLIVSTLGLNYEGITSVIYNYVSNMNKKNLCFEFVIFSDSPGSLIDNFKQIGIVHILPKRKRNVVKYTYQFNKILKKGFDVVHVHGNSGTMIIETCLCKLNRVNKIMIHCHNSKTSHPLINMCFKKIMNQQSDCRLACSKMAGDWLYGKSNYTVLKNAIILEKYKYEESVRQKFREEFGITQQLVIGHVGHFSEQKNQLFILDIFKRYQEINKKSKLLLVSDGPMFQLIKEKAKILNLEVDVIFTGRRSDVNELYQAMDVFIFPSLWEGLGLVTIEAQAAGLPVLASENVPIEAKCTDLFEQMKLSDGAQAWADKIAKILEKTNKREVDYSEEIRQCGYDIKQECNKLRKIYLGE